MSSACRDSGAVEMWVPRGRRLLSGLLGLNVVLLGAALVAAEAFNPAGLRRQEPQLFLLLLMAISLAWMLWYLLWARHQPGTPPHTDHHAGGVTVTGVLLVFAVFSVLLQAFRMGYYTMMAGCKPLAKILTPFIEAPFLALQTYLLWAHSKDCVHKHKIQTRSGLIVTLSVDCAPLAELDGACLLFRRGYEVLYPFNMEYYLLAGCMLYVLWKNVWVGTERRGLAFLLFYGYHLVLVPVMALGSLAGILVLALDQRGRGLGRRGLDVLLLVAAALGQLSLSYFSLVAALAVGAQGMLGSLDLAYSLLSLLELVLQNVFIIDGLHRHSCYRATAQPSPAHTSLSPAHTPA
ncbi:hypothetical protein AAFF_G00255220 [Aldrovandia affinis]|uniref:Uncharacterized protein n=1 Tax=Aldrovandia affinis TaxID=143900 RepID=A0AAD7W3M3_9TELE|nr:hypothetical protein AAFF_G00255220 [Aldrovandia affinis]